MKGMILAGGTGTRLKPLTRIINKHLLPVGKLPMIFHPIQKLKEAGVNEIVVVTNVGELPLFESLLRDESLTGVTLHFAEQHGPNGIADGIKAGKPWLEGEPFIVLLGDNLFEDDLTRFLTDYKSQKIGAKVLLKEVSDPHRYGIAELDEESKQIVSIEEKPMQPKSSYCVTGIYMFDETIYDLINRLSPSQRGELEITDVNNLYINESILTYDFLDGWWLDAGTHEALHEANCHFFQNQKEEADG